MKQLPIACTLSPDGLNERRSQFRRLLDQIAELRVTERRFLARFEPSSQVIRDVAGFVSVERDCCQFLRFSIIAEEAQGPVWLSIAGPPGTGPFIHEMAAGA